MAKVEKRFNQVLNTEYLVKKKFDNDTTEKLLSKAKFDSVCIESVKKVLSKLGCLFNSVIFARNLNQSSETTQIELDFIWGDLTTKEFEAHKNYDQMMRNLLDYCFTGLRFSDYGHLDIGNNKPIFEFFTVENWFVYLYQLEINDDYVNEGLSDYFNKITNIVNKYINPEICADCGEDFIKEDDEICSQFVKISDKTLYQIDSLINFDVLREFTLQVTDSCTEDDAVIGYFSFTDCYTFEEFKERIGTLIEDEIVDLNELYTKLFEYNCNN